MGFEQRKHQGGNGELNAKKRGSRGPGRVQQTQAAENRSAAGGMRRGGCVRLVGVEERGSSSEGCSLGHPFVVGAEWGVEDTATSAGISSSGEGVPWPAPGARGLKVRHPRGKGRAWGPGGRNRASCGCRPLAQGPQGHMQAKTLPVTASPTDVQTPKPANGRRTGDAASSVCWQRYWCSCNL